MISCEVSNIWIMAYWLMESAGEGPQYPREVSWFDSNVRR